MADKMVSAVVVRGSYTTPPDDKGERRNVIANQGDASKVMVPERHLKTFDGILVAADVYAALSKQRGTASASTVDETLGENPEASGERRKR